MKVTFLNFVILKDQDIGLVGIWNLQVALENRIELFNNKEL